MRRILRGCAWLVLVAGNVQAQPMQVVSPRADSVSVTIYRDLFALVTETRTVDLPAGPVTLVFEGVVDTLIPQSAVVTDTGRAVDEGNYDFESLSPARLLQKSIGRTVMLTRTIPGSGKVRQVPATLLSADSAGVVFRTTDGTEALHCSGLPEQLSFEEVPGELQSRPTLSIRLAAGAAGKRQVRVSYIAPGFGWSTHYVGNLDAGSERMDLRGWLTLENHTATGFRQAQVQVVAGQLNLLDQDDGGTSFIGDTANYRTDDALDEARREAAADARDDFESMLDREWATTSFFRGCYPLGTSHISAVRRQATGLVDAIQAQDIGSFPDGEIMEVIVTGIRSSMAAREKLADYQMYRLPGPTDLSARQSKQVAFLHKPRVMVERFYGLRLSSDFDVGPDYAEEENFIPLQARVAWRNRLEDGLGEPLPGGVVRFFEPTATGTLFAGEAEFKDTTVGAPVDVGVGLSLDLGVDITSSAEEPDVGLLTLLTRRVHLPIRLRIVNDKARPVLVEVRQGPIEELENLRVTDASLPAVRKSGDYAWRFMVPADGEQALSYTVSGRVPDWEE